MVEGKGEPVQSSGKQQRRYLIIHLQYVWAKGRVLSFYFSSAKLEKFERGACSFNQQQNW